MTATLAVNTVPELLMSEQAQAALKMYVESLTTERPVTLTVRGETITIQAGYDTTVTLSKTGVSGRSYSMSRTRADQMAQQISTMADALAKVAVQERLVATIKRKYMVDSDQRLGEARVITINV